MARITLKPINQIKNCCLFSFSSKSHPRRQSHAALLARWRKVIFLITSLQRLMEKMPGHDDVHRNQGLTSLNANQFSSRVVKYRCLVEALHVLSGHLRYTQSQGLMQTKSIKVFWFQSILGTLVRIFLLPKGFPVSKWGRSLGKMSMSDKIGRSSISRFGRNCAQNRRASAVAGQ